MTSSKQSGHASHSRFIPREEMPAFAAWTPGAFGAPKPAGASAAPAPAPAPTEADWQARLHQARAQGYQDGLRDGQAGMEAFKLQCAAQSNARFEQRLAALDAQWDQLEQDMSQALVRSVVQLARQVVRTELQTRPQLVAQVAEEAVNAIVLSARHLRLRVHPQDQACVREEAAEALAARAVRVIADPQVEPGGCLLESDMGLVDARIETRWAQAAAVFGRDDAWNAPSSVPGAATGAESTVESAVPGDMA